MATGQFLNILDLTTRLDPNMDQAPIAEMLSQCNDFEADAAMVEGNEITGHTFTFRTSIPSGSWASYYQGTPYGKSTTAQGRVGIGTLRDYSLVDRNLARDSGNPASFRENEDIAFLEGMSQTWTQTGFYGNTVLTPAQYMGLSNFYNTVTTTTAANAANVIDCLGTGSSNSSIWLIDWGPRSIYIVYPRGSRAGLYMDDLGDTVPGYDSLGNPFPCYQTMFEQRGSIVPEDWRRAVRAANIDVTAAGLAGPNAADLFAIMSRMVLRPPTLSANTSGITKSDAPNEQNMANRPYFYTNRTVRGYMDIQGMRNRNVLITINDAAGRVQDTFRGVPVHIVDQLTTTEARVT